MVPRPPLKEAPPRMTAAITSISRPSPAVVGTDPRYAILIIAASALTAPEIINPMILTRSVLMPTRLAALGLPPVAYML